MSVVIDSEITSNGWNSTFNYISIHAYILPCFHQSKTITFLGSLLQCIGQKFCTNFIQIVISCIFQFFNNCLS